MYKCNCVQSLSMFLCQSTSIRQAIETAPAAQAVYIFQLRAFCLLHSNCVQLCAHIFLHSSDTKLGLLFYTFAKVSARIGWLVYENVKLRKYLSFSSCFVFASKPTVSPLDSDTFKFRSLVLCFIYDMNFFAHFALF